MTGLIAAAALLLVFSGLTKLRSPAVAMTALAAARLTTRALTARALGAVQVAVAAAVLVVPLRAAGGLVAVTYLALAAFAWRLLRVAPEADCGCFGEAASAAPVTPTHVAGNLLLAATGAAASITAGPSVVAFAGAHPAAGALLAVLAAVLAGLCVLLMTALPALTPLLSTPREPTR